MKVMITVFSMLAISFGAQAATVTIKPGESVQIQPNRMTTVTCSGSGAGSVITIPTSPSSDQNCNSKVSNLRKKFEFCTKGMSVASCVDKLMPDFRSNNAGCMEEASMTCIEFCQQGMSVGSCMDKCK